MFNYIQTKLEEQNSDILYLFRFKMIDELKVILNVYYLSVTIFIDKGNIIYIFYKNKT